jgi:hypothetical protein
MSSPDSNRVELYYPPLTLSLEKVDQNAETATLGMKVACRLGTEFCYEKDIVRYTLSDYDRFVTDLSSLITGRQDSASLEDTNKLLKLTIGRYPKAALFELSAVQANSTYGSEARLTYSCPMHYDLINIIRDRFRDLPRG